MKLHKQLKWLHPYLEAINHLVPMDRLFRINLTFYKGARPSFIGLCTTYKDESFSILIKMPTMVKNKIPLEAWAQEEVLCHLSHELSHMVHWEHTSERFLLETFIYHQFAVVLHRLGYEEERNKVR